MAIDDAELKKRRYYLEWATGQRTEMTWEPANFGRRHPFRYNWFLFTFFCCVSLIGIFLIPLGPLVGIWAALRQPSYVKRGAQLESQAYKAYRKADRARRRAAGRAIDSTGAEAIHR